MRWLISLVFILTSGFSVAFENFITRDKHQLFDGGTEFRFAGIHAPELHRIENDAKGKCAGDPRGWGQYFQWPTAQEQENWIHALVGTGHKAMRIYVLSVAEKSDLVCERSVHILAPTTKNGMPRLNESAMVVYDRMISLSEQYGLRLILPFIDHWEWWGGRKQLAAFYGEEAHHFYDVESKTYQAYLDIIRQVINRKNTLTGRYYYEEKAIMAWETGNELKDTNASFLANTAAFISSLAPNQLIVDGTYLKINSFAIANPHIDIISNHFYTVNDNNKPQTIKDDLQSVAGQKAYFVGEFGLESIDMMTQIMDTAVGYQYMGAKAVGAFIWGFRGHRHNGGFYFHREYTGHYSYRIPGFKEADSNDEIALVNMVRDAIARMDGKLKASPLPAPLPPKLRKIDTVSDIRWMGAALGQSYNVLRATNPTGPWRVIATNISDGKLAFNPATDTLFADTDELNQGQTYYYKVVAENEGGRSGLSNTQSYTVKPLNSQ